MSACSLHLRMKCVRKSNLFLVNCNSFHHRALTAQPTSHFHTSLSAQAFKFPLCSLSRSLANGNDSFIFLLLYANSLNHSWNRNANSMKNHQFLQPSFNTSASFSFFVLVKNELARNGLNMIWIWYAFKYIPRRKHSDKRLTVTVGAF